MAAPPLNMDRDLAKELYINGMPMMEIAKRTGVKRGTLAQWKHREHWDDDRLKPEGNSVEAVQATAQALSNQALTIAARILCRLEKMAMTCPREAKDIATALSSAYMSARKALGLDDERNFRSVSLTIVNSGVSDRPSSPIIDLSPEPEPTDSSAQLEQPGSCDTPETQGPVEPANPV